ncbi:MAG: peptidylprolyl isomerase [Pyrinomonadaceae bacterium]
MSVVCLTLTLVMAACGGDAAQQSKDFDAEPSEGGANVKKGVKPEPDQEIAVIDTDYGRIVVELYPNLAPQQVERFKKLAAEGFYNGTRIHRIDPQLGIIQGGDQNSKDSNPFNDGTGKSPYPDLPAEFSDVPYERGILGAARGAAENTANSQFFITLKSQPAFNNRYTVFGKVIEGISNADVIAGAPVREGTDKPADAATVKSVTLQKR